MNIGEQLRSLVGSSVSGGIEELLARIPGYTFARNQVRSIVNRNKAKLLGRRTDTTVVDRGEINTAFKKISKEISDSYNPITYIWNVIRYVFGSSKQERVQGEIKVLRDYSGLYDSHMFTNKSLKFLTALLKKEISKKESMFSRFGLHTDSKVFNDPNIQEIIAAIKDWLHPFNTLAKGGIKNEGVRPNDLEFLTEIRNDFAYGKYAKYSKELVSALDQVIQSIQSTLAKTAPSQAPVNKRNLGQNLAAPA